MTIAWRAGFTESNTSVHPLIPAITLWTGTGKTKTNALINRKSSESELIDFLYWLAVHSWTMISARGHKLKTAIRSAIRRNDPDAFAAPRSQS